MSAEIARLQDKNLTISAGGEYTIQPDAGYTAIHRLDLNVNIGVQAEEKTVNFIDYDGTIVASYTGTEVQALSALPSAPDHTSDTPSLTFDEWNWTLAEIKSYNTNYPEAIIWVGANYHTTDGKIHLFYRIDSDYDSYGVKFSAYDLGGTVDWGDGSSAESFAAGAVTHVYTKAGYYHCVIDSLTGSIIVGSSKTGDFPWWKKMVRCHLPSTISMFRYQSFCNSGIEAISIPSSANTFQGSGDFSRCMLLGCLVMPRGSSFDSSLFQYSYLKRVSLPGNLTSITSSSMPQSLRSVTIPDSVTTIGSSAFASFNFLQNISIPTSVTTIESKAFDMCPGLCSVFLRSTTPPTLGSSDSFTDGFVQHIYVPAQSVETYKTATNWSTFASIIEAIPSA